MTPAPGTPVPAPVPDAVPDAAAGGAGGRGRNAGGGSFGGGVVQAAAVRTAGNGTAGRRRAGRRAAAIRPLAGAGGIALAVLALAVLALSATAQTAPPPFTFGLDLRVEADDNRSLAVTSPGTTTTGTARLSFGFLRETGADSLRLDAGVLLRAAGGAGAATTATGLQEPSVAARYTRTAANASLSFGLRYSEREIRSLRSLDDFLDPDTGTIVLPPDFDALVGTGTQTNVNADLRASIGDAAPFGLTVTLGLRETGYRNAAATLIPSTTLSAGLSARLRLSDVASARVDLRAARFEPQTGAIRDTTGVTLGFAQEFPRGTFGVSASADTTPDGTRLGVSVSRSLELPAGALSVALGATRPATSDRIALTGSLSLRQDLPRGAITAGLVQSVGSGANDAERLVTAVNLGLAHEVGPNGRLALGADYAISTIPATSISTQSANLRVSYSHALTQDWGLNVGYVHRLLDDTGTGQANSNSVFFGLSRSWP